MDRAITEKMIILIIFFRNGTTEEEIHKILSEFNLKAEMVGPILFFATVRVPRCKEKFYLRILGENKKIIDIKLKRDISSYHSRKHHRHPSKIKRRSGL